MDPSSRKLITKLFFPRLSLQFLVPLLLVAFAALTSAFFYFNESRVDQHRLSLEVAKQLRTELNHRQGVIEYLLANGDIARAEHEVEDLTIDPNVKLSVLVDNTDAVIAVSERQLRGHSLDAILEERFDKDTVTALIADIHEAQSTKRSHVYISQDGMDVFGTNPVNLKPVGPYLGSKQVGAILVHYDLTAPLLDSQVQTWERIFFYAEFLLAQSILLWLFLNFFITRRIRSILSVIGRFAAGDHQVRAEELGNDEVAVIGRGLNNMMDEVAEEIKKRTEMEVFIRNVLDNVGEGFAVISKDLTIEHANKAYSDIVGIPVNAMIGELCHKVTHGSELPCFQNQEGCPVFDTFADGKAHSSMHVHAMEKGKMTHLEISSYPMLGKDGELVAAIETISDITEKVDLQEQLAQSQKMEAVGLLAGGVAHDFNNNLTAILGYADLARQNLREDDPLRYDLDQIIYSGERAADLVRGLLAFSRKQVMTTSVIDLNDLTEGLEEMLRRVVGEDIDLKCSYSERPVLIRADKSQIEQVIVNLVTNARDVMPQGGTLSIRTGITDDLSAGEHLIEPSPPGKFGYVAVRDTGHGMDEETKSKIFEPFFTTKEFGRGSGLGLAMVYGIVQQHQGDVIVTSAPDKGSEFRILLPLCDDTSYLPISAPKGEHRTAPCAGTILVAEDDEQVREYIRSVLEGSGYQVVEAFDGVDAVEKFQEHSGAIDLLLLDVVMPRLGGSGVLETIQRTRPNIKAIFISGYARDIVEQKGVHEDSVELINKPFQKETLLLKIAETLESPHQPDA